ncbi:DsbA family oxidoreductase [Paenibacillus chondroitinus]|uniref:DsbA family oxidoreductase n=1 Tax=Paenibacillus chondroitinus TaxID=59842 RepID=A0ABU6DI18_9BACL|nr:MULTISPECIES: DsbA family oxidoreductase [Paenibacillus]MCY9659193.1 DsbA family oxidoreductase [Paenibacillus anseongense]MEB4796472.1 DsbA family oxidoreductase [Paenibacillus chondroitinus]
MSELLIDVYMDTSCPWCRMGTTSLLTALKQLPEDKKATVRWNAFQINPGIRPEGEDYRQVMIGRLGGVPQFEARKQQYHENGNRFGLKYNMDIVQYTPNTTLSHQLISMAPEHVKVQLIEKIYTAYFEDGVNIGDVDELVKIGSSVGIGEAAELKERLLQGEGLDKVELGQRTAQKLGVRGVPFFVINEEFSLSGLQSPAEFVKLFEQL